MRKHPYAHDFIYYLLSVYFMYDIHKCTDMNWPVALHSSIKNTIWGQYM